MKPYPNAMNYDSDYDFYLDCVNYSTDSVKAHYNSKKEEAIKALDELGEQASGLAESFRFESSFEDELIEHLDAIQKLLDNAEPLKCLEL